MSEPIMNGYTATTTRIKAGNIGGASRTITNTSEQDITINSVGLFCTPDTNTSSYQWECLLLTKTKLDTPLIIKPSETKTITITIDFNKMIDNVNNA